MTRFQGATQGATNMEDVVKDAVNYLVRERIIACLHCYGKLGKLALKLQYGVCSVARRSLRLRQWADDLICVGV